MDLLSYPQACYVRAANASAVFPTAIVLEIISKTICIGRRIVFQIIKIERGSVVMAGEAKGEKAATQFRSPVEAHASIVGNPHENRARLVGSSRRNREPTTTTNPTILAVEQWLCLLWGLVCMASGVWGICMKYDQELPSGDIPWLGSMYGPTLRGTAVACFVSGVVLVRRGLARPELSTAPGSRKALRSGDGNGARDTEKTPVRRTILGFKRRSKGRN